MKIVVIGGSGLIGTKVVDRLRRAGHEVVPASTKSGVNILTGEGLATAMAGAEVVVDVANSPSFEDQPAMDFFVTAGRNLSAAEKTAGVSHHVALSVVGTERLLNSGYFRAKMAQEEAVRTSGIPFTIVRATQFFEFLGGIAGSGTRGETIHMSPALFQPIGSEDVADAVADAALAPPRNGIIEVGGPERIPLDEAVRKYLAATHDPRTVVSDIHAGYFGIQVDDRSLTASAAARLGALRLDDWLAQAAH